MESDDNDEVSFNRRHRGRVTQRKKSNLAKNDSDEEMEEPTIKLRRRRQADRDRGQNGQTRTRTGEVSDSDSDVIDAQQMPPKERNRFFWVMVIRYISVFVLFVLLHQLVSRTWIDPWRGVVPERPLAERVREQLCTPGQPCSYEIPDNLGQ